MAGQYAAASDSVACDPCPPGRIAGAGATGCTECPAGQIYFTGYFMAAAGGACVGCPPGQFTAEVRIPLVVERVRGTQNQGTQAAYDALEASVRLSPSKDHCGIS